MRLDHLLSKEHLGPSVSPGNAGPRPVQDERSCGGLLVGGALATHQLPGAARSVPPPPLRGGGEPAMPGPVVWWTRCWVLRKRACLSWSLGFLGVGGFLFLWVPGFLCLPFLVGVGVGVLVVV